MKLLGSHTSPYARKVRVVMSEKKLEYLFELEDVWAPGTQIQQFNPLGKVPCLVMEDGAAMFDSRVIVEYLDTLTPVGKLIPGSGRERAEVKVWEALADGLCDAAIAIRLELTQREPAQRSQALIDRQMKKVHAALRSMSEGLGDRTWCCGTAFSLADVAVGCALDYLRFRFAEIDWRNTYPNLGKLLDRCSQRASFIETAPPAA